MDLPETLLTVFSGEVEEQDGPSVIVVPDRELNMGDLSVGDTYRIAILSQRETKTGSTDGESAPDHQRTRESADPPVEEGEQHEVEIEDVGEQGDGIARVGPGFIVFVPGTKVGDRVTVEITKAQENFAFADVVEKDLISKD